MIQYCDEHGAYTEDRCPKCKPPEEEHPATQAVGGLDLAKYHDYSAMVDLRVEHHQARIRGIKVWPHVNYYVVVDDVAARYRKTGMRMLGIDATGVGEPISELFYARGVVTQDIKFGAYVDWTNPYGDKEHAPVKYAMVEYARACLQSGFVKFPSNAGELVQQLREQEIMIGAADRPQYAHPEGRHDDLAWAFLIALYVSRPWLTGNGMWASIAAGTPEFYKPQEAYRK